MFPDLTLWWLHSLQHQQVPVKRTPGAACEICMDCDCNHGGNGPELISPFPRPAAGTSTFTIINPHSYCPSGAHPSQGKTMKSRSLVRGCGVESWPCRGLAPHPCSLSPCPRQRISEFTDTYPATAAPISVFMHFWEAEDDLHFMKKEIDVWGKRLKSPRE